MSKAELMENIDAMDDEDYDYGDDDAGPAAVGNTQLEFTDFSQVGVEDGTMGSIEDTTDQDQLLPAPVTASNRSPGSGSGGQNGGSPRSTENPSCISLDYYKQYFDVDTEQVLFRLKSSFWPLNETRFLKSIEGKGDLYGPFWVATTLIFAIAFSGNIVDYKNSVGKGEQDVWRYDFDKVSLAATMIYGYITLAPFALWATMKWKLKKAPGLLDTITLYGYSIFIYIPVSFLCIFPWIGSEIAWTSILVAMGVSGSVLLINVHEVLKPNNGWPAVSPYLAGIAVVHIGLTLALKFYFFTHEPPSHDSMVVAPTNLTNVTTTPVPIAE